MTLIPELERELTRAIGQQKSPRQGSRWRRLPLLAPLAGSSGPTRQGPVLAVSSGTGCPAALSPLRVGQNGAVQVHCTPQLAHTAIVGQSARLQPSSQRFTVAKRPVWCLSYFRKG